MARRSRLHDWARSFATGEGGVAAVEFALILPIMLLLYVGMVEGSTLITMDRKVQTVSGAVGDLVARSNGAISAATLDNYVKVAGGIMTPYPTDKLVQIVTQVRFDTNGNPVVDWSRRYEGQEVQTIGAHAKGTPYPLPDDAIAIAQGEPIIVTECALAYPPLYGFVFDSTINLYRQNFFMPRFGEPILLN